MVITMNNTITNKVIETEHFLNELQYIDNLKNKITELRKTFKFCSYHTTEMITLQFKYCFAKFYLHIRKKQNALKIRFQDTLNNSRKKKLLTKH